MQLNFSSSSSFFSSCSDYEDGYDEVAITPSSGLECNLGDNGVAKWYLDAEGDGAITEETAPDDVDKVCRCPELKIKVIIVKRGLR